VILSAMQNNGSPTPLFETDEDRTWFRVTLPIHQAFDPNVKHRVSNAIQVEQRLTQFLRNIVVNDQANDQAVILMARVLLLLQTDPHSKSELLEHIKLKNHNDNVKRYIEPLEINHIIAKTIPSRPKSPNQKYCLTEKGKSLLLEIK